jgi:hypothetical protein
MTPAPSFVQYSKSVLRVRAAAFARDHASDSREAAQRQIFWNDFFAIFGRQVREVGLFEELAKRMSTKNHGWIDLLVPGEMAVEHKSAGENLDDAMGQVMDYYDSVPQHSKPWLLVACDFREFYWKDLERRVEGRFTLEELPEHIEHFWWLAGYDVIEDHVDEEEANLKATGYMAQLHDAVLASGYDSHSLREWLTRILFCLFADDTDVWDRDLFKHYILLNTRPDGSDLGSRIAYLFQILNEPYASRANNLDEDLRRFTYINGDLFSNTLPIPNCDQATRDALIAACHFNWSAISPAIFGSMFQNVMTPAERRQLGAHYTTEANILRTIRPLFIDALERELEGIRVTNSPQSRAALNAFHERLASLTFMDPACGCGNFLVIAYREIRRLESETLRRLNRSSAEGVRVLDVTHYLKVTVDQFYGIELEEFPARIARTALYLMDHKVNREFSQEFGEYFARFPIPASPHIKIANALRIDWNEVLTADRASYVFGNPPFLGKQQRSQEQQDDMTSVFGTDRGSGTLDYVAAWYRKSLDYAVDLPVQFAYVSTNSITQGEQVPVLWKQVFERGFEITFAHRTFAWSSEARGTAHVHCVIIGFSQRGVRPSPHQLFDYADISGEPSVRLTKEINCYLAAGPSIIVAKRTDPLISGIPPMSFGSMPNDDGNLIVDEETYVQLVQGETADSNVAKYLRRLVGARDMLNGGRRWCLWLEGAEPTDITNSPFMMDRIRNVRDYRLRSNRQTTRSLASTPALFGEIRRPQGPFLGIPRVSSESRRVVPMVFYDDREIPSDSILFVPSAPIWLFAILQSSMFTSWLNAVGGRLKSDYRMSAELVYNTFPFPKLTDEQRKKLEEAGNEVLTVRATYGDSTLADLYNALSMPADLARTHAQLDRTVIQIFAGRRQLRTDADRLAVLLERYELLTASLFTSPRPQRSRRASAPN